VESGLDNGNGGGTAGNGVLEPGEIRSTEYVCAVDSATTGGSSAYGGLVATALESAGSNCAGGGVRVDTGLDNGAGSGSTARDGILQAGEVTVSKYVCNGANGTAGTNGFSSLSAVSAEPAGGNCPTGGVKIDSGLDNGSGGGSVARDNVLQSGEITVTRYICNGAAGPSGYSSLMTSVPEAAGLQCVSGGLKISIGLDNGAGTGSIARDGSLQIGEITETRYICHGTNGTSGFSSLVATAAEIAGANCPNGGTKVTTGLDNGASGGVARDGVLQTGEVTEMRYVCNGAAGATGATGAAGAAGATGLAYLVSTTPEPAGSNCVNGGLKISAGPDDGSGGAAARDGVLQSTEITQTRYVCNGAAGANGTDGFANLLVTEIEASGGNCRSCIIAGNGGV